MCFAGIPKAKAGRSNPDRRIWNRNRKIAQRKLKCVVMTDTEPLCLKIAEKTL